MRTGPRLAVTLALVVAGCGSPTPTAPPAASAPAAASAAGRVPGSVVPAPTSSAPVAPSAQPQPSGSPVAGGGTGVGAAQPPAPKPPVVLPVPTLTDPFAIGDALYDANRVPDAVMSMLDVMGVDIVTADGTPAQPGREPAAGARWLYDIEVQSMITRTVDELVAAGDSGTDALPFTMGDLYDALAPALPGASPADVVQGYTTAYVRHPDALVPRLMLGQPIDGSTRLSTAQAWLLLVDGFVGPAPSTGDRVTAVLAASGRGPAAWGTATHYLPFLGNLAPMTEQEMRELLVQLPFLLACITWDLTSAIVHEGHGGLGSPVTLVGQLQGSLPIISGSTHRPLVEQVNGGFGSPEGIAVTWTGDEVLAEHGTFERPLPAMTTLGSDAISTITYTPRREAGNGVGEPFEDVGTVELTAPAAQLILAFYRMPNPQLQPMLESALLGTLGLNKAVTYANVDIGWHAPGLTLKIVDDMNVVLDVGAGFEGRMSRKGKDSLSGSLSRQADGSYTGILTAAIDRRVKMEFTVPLAAGGCEGKTDTEQAMYVVAKRVPSDVDHGTDQLQQGTFGKDDLVLTLYPIGDPTKPPVWCEEMLRWTGTRTINGRTVKRTLIPLNDLRWTEPGELRVHLPDVHEHLEYRDVSDASVVRGIKSTWTFTVDRGE